MAARTAEVSPPAPVETSTRKVSLSDVEMMSPCRRVRSPLSASTSPSLEGCKKCGYCLLAQAAVACPCTPPSQFFCSACFQTHAAYGTGHYPVPIKAMGLIQSEEQRQTFFTFAARFESLQNTLLSNLEAITSFQLALNTQFDRLIFDLQSMKVAYLAQLDKAKSELTVQLQEALMQLEEVLYTRDFKPLNDLEVQVLACWTRDPDLRAAQLFTGEVDFSEVRSQITKVTYFRTHTECLRSEEEPPEALAGVSFNSLRLYQLPDCQERRRSLRCSFTVGTFYCFLDTANALCLGGLPPSPTVQKLSLQTALLSPGPAMQVARGFAGIHKHGNGVYVFGGNWPSTSSCEKLSLEDSAWLPLPKMCTPRYAFNPVYYKGEMYLADCQNDHSIEAFSVAMETFRLLPYTLPAEMSGNSVACLVGRELHIATAYGHLAVLSLVNKKAQFQVKQVTNTPVISSWPPLVVGKAVFFVNYSTGQLRRYTPETGLFI